MSPTVIGGHSMRKALSFAAQGVRRFATERPKKTVRESWSFLSEIVGNPALAGRGIGISAGEILKLVDLAGASSAIMHIGHGRLNTLAFDHLDFLTPIFHGEQVHMDARVAHVGSTSVAVHCVGRKKDLMSRGWIHTHEALVVFVALGPDGRPETAPELVCETAEEQKFREMVKFRLELGKIYQKEQEAISVSNYTEPSPEAESTENSQHQERIDMEDTELRLRKIFMPRHLNALGSIFGGDLLEWMESAAVSCARHHLRNPGALTVAMDRVFFHRPVLPDQLADLTARVVRVGRDAVEIETEVQVLRPFLSSGGAAPFTHTGFFTVLNAADAGYRRPVLAGLRAVTPDARRRAARAQHRAGFEAAHAAGQAWLARRARLAAKPFLPERLAAAQRFGDAA